MNRTVGIAAALLWLAAANGSGAEPRKLTLDEALALALERSPHAMEAQSRLDEAEARRRAAQAGARPTLKARGAADYWTEDQRLFPATKNGEAGAFGPYLLGAELVAGFPLYTGGRIAGETKAAEWNRQAAEHQWVRAREILAFQVTASFYDLLARDEVLKSLETAVRAMEAQQRAIQSLVEAEKAARVDLLRANVRRAELFELQLRERNNRVARQRAWAVLLGLDDADAPEAQGTLTLRQPPAGPDPADCRRKAMEQRADYWAARAAVAAAESAVWAARAGYRPTVSAQASYGVRWMPEVVDRRDGADDQAAFGRAGIAVEFPLFDGRLTAARVAEQEARKRGAQERLRALELQIRYEVETALADIASAMERVRTSEQAVQQAEESFRIMQEKYELGKGTMTDVLDAQAAVVAARTSHARALADLAVADARRRLAVGEILP